MTILAVENLNMFTRNAAFITFFFNEFSKTRDKALRNIYNHQFNDNSENLWVVF